MTTDRPLFVMGCPRSGTTLLQVMLHGHPRIAIPTETRFLVSAYLHRREFGDLRTEAGRRALAAHVTRKGTRFPQLGIPRGEMTERIVQGPPTVGSALGLVLRAYAERFERPRWGDKRPSYYRFVPELRRMFPDAQFVHLVRDGRDCVASLKSMPWWHRSSHDSVLAWMEASRATDRAAAALPASTFHRMSYEDLTSDPEATLRRLCAFLGEAFDPAMLDSAGIARDVIPSYKVDGWHGNLRGEVSNRSVGSWRDRLEPWEVELCEWVMGDRLRAYGYELSGAARPSLSHRRTYLRTKVGRLRRQYAQTVPDRVRHRLRPEDVADRVRGGA